MRLPPTLSHIYVCLKIKCGAANKLQVRKAKSASATLLLLFDMKMITHTHTRERYNATKIHTGNSYLVSSAISED